jgi:cell division protein ZapA (FtsZ GTPase activity inhibitor)
LSDQDQKGIFARLRKLPVDFLLALINTTAILVIVAAILTLLTLVRIDSFAGRMTETVLSKIDLPSKSVLANLRNLTEEVRTLGNTLREIKVGENPNIQSELARLREVLTALNVSVDRLTDTRTMVTDQAIGDLSRAVTETLTKMRGCTSNVGQMPPNLSDNTTNSPN